MAFYTATDFKEAFAIFDKNGDGKISSNEIGDVLKKLGYQPSQEQLAKMLATVDLDGNGFLDFDEFKSMLVGNPISLSHEKELEEIFKNMDKNGDGFIGAKELKQMMKNIGQKCSKNEIKRMIQIADVNKDGKVDFEGRYMHF
eukprot:gene15258-16833_t